MTQFKELLQGLAKDENEEIYSLVGRVVAVDKNKRTCTVQPLEEEEATIYNVRLQASMNSSNGLLCFPAPDSFVVVTFLSEDSAYVALFSEVESVELVVESKKIDFDKDGFLLQSSQGSLLSAWQDLLSILKEFKLFTNMGATISITPDVLGKIQVLENKIQSLLKN